MQGGVSHSVPSRQSSVVGHQSGVPQYVLVLCELPLTSARD